MPLLEGYSSSYKVHGWKLFNGVNKFTYGSLLTALVNSVSEAERQGEDFKRTHLEMLRCEECSLTEEKATVGQLVKSLLPSPNILGCQWTATVWTFARF
jgi:hypothetical protein